MMKFLDHPMNRAPRCGARNRAGQPCRAPAMRNGRCRLHGGHSLGGPASATYRHGRFTQDAIAERREVTDLLRRSKETLRVASFRELVPKTSDD